LLSEDERRFALDAYRGFALVARYQATGSAADLDTSIDLLWAEVVPEAIRRQFWEQAGRIRLFSVASDMDMVPWELLYPIDGSNDAGFLVEQFPVVRRVYGQGRVRRLSMSSAAYIAAGCARQRDGRGAGGPRLPRRRRPPSTGLQPTG
jgi:hypothetical protein